MASSAAFPSMRGAVHKLSKRMPDHQPHRNARDAHLCATRFEDTQAGILYQNKQQVNGPYILGNPKELAAMLNQFYSYTEPDIEGLEEAVGEFKEGVPELARGPLHSVTRCVYFR